MGYYSENPPTNTVNVLGTEYSVYVGVESKDDPMLAHCDGYCDKTVKRIVVAAEGGDSELGDFTVYEKTNLRHELIHAFLFESGLDGNSNWDNGVNDHPEQTVEWIALQFPKILKAFQAVGAM